MFKRLLNRLLGNSIIIELVNDGDKVIINSNLKKIDPLTITPAETKAFLWLQESRLDNNVKQINVKG